MSDQISISRIFKKGIFFGIIATAIVACYGIFAPRHWPFESAAELNRIRSDMVTAEKQWEIHQTTNYDIDVKVVTHMSPCYTDLDGKPTTLSVRQGKLIITDEVRKYYLEKVCYISSFLPPQAFETVGEILDKTDPNVTYRKIEFDPEYGFIASYSATSNSSWSSAFTSYKFSNFRPVASTTPTTPPAEQTTTHPFTTPIWIDLSPELYIRQIREDAFVITHAFPWPANSLLVEMDNSELVLVGTPYTPAATNKVLDWIERRFGKRSIVAINPGYHVDNLGGNQALFNRHIQVYGSDLTTKLLRERGAQTRQVLLGMLQGPDNQRYFQTHANLPYTGPSHEFAISQGLRLSFGNDKVQIYYPGPSQSPDKVVVYFSRQKILFGSCMILGGDQIGNIADADLKNWPDAVRKLTQFDAEIVVPGHGERLDVGLIQHTLDLLSAKP
jgi:glyoxylase-like metal-dependent hydrolase (beta-lactamase superfamily II)